LAEIDPMVRDSLKFITAERIDTVLDAALVKKPHKVANAPVLDALPVESAQEIPKAQTPIPQ
ncbi:hypothetical protein, partial [Anaerotruncus rubiinfantis]